MSVHSLIGIAAILLCAYALRRWWARGGVVLGIGVFLIGIAPVLNIFPITEISAERFLYFPSLGFSLLVACVFTWTLARRRDLTLVIFVALLAAYSVRTVTRNNDWRDETTLFAKTASAASDNARAHLNLGNAHYRAGRHREALEEYRRAVSLDPGDARVWSGMAGAYKDLGRLDEAFAAMERALAIEPSNPDFRNSLGILLVHRGDLPSAIAEFQRAVKLRPGLARARFNLGLALYNSGDYAGALRAFAEIENKDTDNVLAYYYLAAAESMLGNTDRAAEYAGRFLALYDNADPFRASAREILSGRRPLDSR